MIIEKSAGAVIFRKKEDEIYYLLLRYPVSMRKPDKEYWGFSKGHVEKGEKIEETIKRETEEETGIKDIIFINGFREQEKYFFTRNKKKVFKTVIFFLAETKTKNIRISWEHIDFKWLSYDRAIKKLTFKNAKKILEKANNFLSRKNF